MTELVLMKVQGGILIPQGEESESAIQKMAVGSLIRADFKKMRNPQFHKKYMALLNFAYDNWEPEEKTFKDQVVEKNFDRFRKDIAILSGFGSPVINIKGEVRYEAKSISFAKMDEVEFDSLYQSSINVILKHILKNYTHDDIENTINQLLSFT